MVNPGDISARIDTWTNIDTWQGLYTKKTWERPQSGRDQIQRTAYRLLPAFGYGHRNKKQKILGYRKNIAKLYVKQEHQPTGGLVSSIQLYRKAIATCSTILHTICIDDTQGIDFICVSCYSKPCNKH